jgi:hypothetical protein
MRTRQPKRIRLIAGAGLFLLLIATPLLLGLWRPAASEGSALPGVVGVYADGFSSLGIAGLIALPLAGLFALWLILGEQRAVNRRMLAQRARNRRNGIEAIRTLAIILGAAGLIVGSLSGLYASLIAVRPDVAIAPNLPLTFELAIPCLIIGGIAYAIGRLIR